MRRNTFLGLIALAVLAVVAASFAIKSREPAVPTTAQQRLLHPDLTNRVNDVTKVVIRSPDSTVTLERQGDRWVMPEKAGYPVDFAKVRTLLVQLARLETIEQRTAKPELHSRLQVEDLGAPDAKSLRITLQAKDAVVADLIVGRERPAGEGGGVFVRNAAEPQAWLAKGELRPEKQFVLWLDRNIVNVDRQRVQSVEIAHADGERVALAKPQPGAGDFALQTPVPEGREPKAAHELSALAGIPDYLILEDVRPAAEVTAAAPAVTAEFRTYDGLRVATRAFEQDGNTWVRVEAATVAPAPELAAWLEANKGKDTTEGRNAGQFKTAEDVAKEAEAINARVANWAYRLTDYKTGQLKSRTEQLTQEVKKAEAPAQPEAKPAEAATAPSVAPPEAAAPQAGSDTGQKTN